MATATAGATRPMTAEEKKVIFASSLGTVFEWYDFISTALSPPLSRSNSLPASIRRLHTSSRCLRLLQASWFARSVRWCSVALAT